MSYPSNQQEYWCEKFNEEQRQMQIYYQDLGYFNTRPSTIQKPKITLDGNKWCALLGTNLQEGIVGFGDSPEESCLDFDRVWSKNIHKQ